jgi:hypothetical protein
MSSIPVSLVTLFRSASQLDESKVDRDSVEGENEMRGCRGPKGFGANRNGGLNYS